MKKWFATYLLLAVSTLSWAYSFEVDGIYYNTLDYFRVEVTYKDGNYNSYSGTIVIPSSVSYDHGYTVTSIGPNAFRSCSGLTSVTIPNSVTSIGNYAFSGCSVLTSINIPNSVTSIGNNAFDDCSGLPVTDNLRYADTYLVKAVDKTKSAYNIKEGTRFIGSFAFQGCSGLKSVTIPNSVTSIGDFAFLGCNSLTRAEFASIESLCKIAFENDYSNPLCYVHHLYIDGQEVTKVVIPNSVTSIGSYAFDGCSDLTSVTIPNSVTSIGNYAFQGCSGLKSVTIPESVTSIGSSAFEECSGLTSVTIGSGVTSIGRSAFQGCSGLTSVTIPESVTSIGSSAFYNCSGLTSVTIGSGVTSIGYGAFRYCSSLTSVTIGKSVTSIGDYAFDDCSGLTSITIPNSVWSIGEGAFNGCSGLKSVTIPESVTNIGEYAFWRCSGLTSVIIGSGVKSIGDNAFSGCSGLKSVTLNSNTLVSKTYTSDSNLGTIFGSQVTNYIIGNNVTSIGKRAFLYCSGLTSVTIGKSVTSIGTSAFEECSGLKRAEFASIESLCKISFEDGSSNPLYYAKHLYINGKEVKDVVIPNSVKSIGIIAFYRCSGLKSVIIPNSVTSIGYGAFSNCSGLTSVTIGSGVTSIGEDAFYECSGLKSVTIGSGVTSIGYEAFYGCSGLTSVTCLAENVPTTDSDVFYNVPQSTATLYVPAGSVDAYKAALQWEDFGTIRGVLSGKCGTNVNFFLDDYILTISGRGDMYDYDSNTQPWKDYKTRIKNVVIEDGVTSIGESAFYGCSGLTSVTIGSGVTSIGNYTFYECSGLTSVTIPESVTSIGGYAFRNCSHLTSVTIGCGVTSIGDYAFSDCSGLTSITIPDGVTSIGSYAFDGCSDLTSVTIPNSVKSIGNNAFYRCFGLKSVTIPNSVTSIGNYTFYGCSGLKSVTIPNSVTSIGVAAFGGCSGLTSVTCFAEEVPSTGSIVFYNVPKSTATLYVPAGSVDAYKAAEQWKEFGTILPINEDDHIYIETNVTSQFPTDFQGWNGATGYTPTQFAPMVTTNDGRTVQVCEKFDGSIAATGTVFKRTLTGLTNGTYRIELYGAAASTKGRDTNIDSDMTQADDGDMTAVYLYATTANGTVKQYIPVHWAISFSEVATAILNNVVVTDGTVEIGMYSQKKFTNWHVVQIKGVTALVDAEELHANTLTRAQSALDDAAYVNVTGEERAALSQAIADNTTVSERTAEAYQAAINALDGATKTFTEAKAGYDGLVAAKTLVEGRSYLYATEAKKSAAEGADAAVATNAADAVSKKDALLTAYRQYAESSALMESIEGAVDVTSIFIRNPKAEEAIDANVWQTVLGKGSGGSIIIRSNEPWTDGNGDTNHRYFDGGNWDASAWDVTFRQKITLPAGRYQLSAMGRSSRDVTLTLFAGEATAEMAHIGAAGGLFDRGWEQTSLEFDLMQEATVSIGVRGVTNVLHNWMSFSGFRLVQFPAGWTAIGEVKTEAESEAAEDSPIYDLMGRRLQKKPASGYYIQGGKTYFVK